MDLFVVNFNKTASYQMSFRIVAFCYRHDLAESSGNDTFSFLSARSHHSVSLSTSSLPICEDGAVIPIQYTVYKSEGTLFIN